MNSRLILSLVTLCVVLTQAAALEAGFSFSNSVSRVETLIDDGGYDAAETLLDAEIAKDRDNSGLYIQYARLLVLTRNFDNGGVEVPGVTGWMSANQAVDHFLKCAVQFDPGCRRDAVATVLDAVLKKAKDWLARDNGIITGSAYHCYLDAAIWAARLDAEYARRWADDFAAMLPRTIEAGFAYSTFRAAFTSAMLEGEETSSMFRTVNRHVFEALERRDDPDSYEGNLSMLYGQYFEGLDEKSDPRFAQIAETWTYDW